MDNKTIHEIVVSAITFDSRVHLEDLRNFLKGRKSILLLEVAQNDDVVSEFMELDDNLLVCYELVDDISYVVYATGEILVYDGTTTKVFRLLNITTS